MAKPAISIDGLKDFLSSQVQDEEKWALNVKLMRAAGMFLGSIVVFRTFGDIMAI